MFICEIRKMMPGELGVLQSMGLQRIEYDLATE